ncbi:MAG: FAD-binding protein [Beijerinckiaceae bacterium]|nr:MAG: FAD-binding protein [Beijerinckiaceae bacterium]
MPEVLSPSTESEAAEAIREARAARSAIVVEGGGTRSGLGRPVEAEHVLSTRVLTGITLYEPQELVISASAGTPLTEIESALAKYRQRLPFEPMDHRTLFGTGGAPTIGAVAACNISGPRRIQSGAARDHLIGIRMVNGFGEIIKSGGRVKKNVTGLDLVKLACGAHGTLGLLTEVTFKLLPQPETSATLALHGLDDAKAITALSIGLTSPFQVTGAAHLPAGIVTPDATAMTLLRLEGAHGSVEYRAGALAKLLADIGTAEILSDEGVETLWRQVRDAEPLSEPREAAIWRISVAPSRGAEVVAALKRKLAVRVFYDWGGGLIWAAAPSDGDAGSVAIRKALSEAGGEQGGHATLVRAPVEIRSCVDVFEPLAEPLMRISAGIKASFDPDRIINPGRMYAGI